MTHHQLTIYNEASAAAVANDRTRLARALRAARNLPRVITTSHHSLTKIFSERIVAHVTYIGWPVRLRENGRYL